MTIPYQTIFLKHKMNVSSLFNAGIYKITCLKNYKVYIGESNNVLSRLGRHCDNLENNRHDCLKLQQDFNKYGKHVFLFEALQCSFELNLTVERKKKEMCLIDKVPLAFRYNQLHQLNWNFYSQKICVKGQVFESLRKAAISLKESRTHIMRKCKDLKNMDYLLLEKTPYKEIYKKKSIACRIDNTNYLSLSDASKALKLHSTTIKNRCKSKKYLNYVFL